MKIQIDGNTVKVNDSSKNIVEIANEYGINIPAPCFYAKKQKGCCHGCAVTIDGVLKYACNVYPTDGMVVVVNERKLKKIRKENLLIYQKGIETGNYATCSTHTKSSSSCGCS